MCLEKFLQECHLLSLARHPNIVQYLTTSCEEDTGHPILLMELCDESLTSLLEKSSEPLPYHTVLNICHDISLALVHLHANGLLHRDLSSNNVLLDGGRAKVTDFGMSKLDVQTKTDTLCPGNVVYMPPEALDAPPKYTDKLDVFSFGVIIVQILTRKFPSPTSERFEVVAMPNDSRFTEGYARNAIPEITRRESHLKLISNSHPLKKHAVSCLNNNSAKRFCLQNHDLHHVFLHYTLILL